MNEAYFALEAKVLVNFTKAFLHIPYKPHGKKMTFAIISLAAI
jgi:hypothetical protein